MTFFTARACLLIRLLINSHGPRTSNAMGFWGFSPSGSGSVAI